MTSKKKGEDPPKMGRPPALVADEKTLEIIRGLGQIQCTTRECAAVLGVSHQTFIKFKAQHQEVAEALEIGSETGKMSLRRKQFNMAETNASMAIWLGKQYLEQSDKQDITAAVTQEVHVSDARTKLEHLLDRQLAAGAAISGTGKPN